MGMPADRSAVCTPALRLRWVVSEVTAAAAAGRELHFAVETEDAETGRRGHVIAVTTAVGAHGGALCSDPDFRPALLFDGPGATPDAVTETVKRLEWWGVAGFVVGRRVVVNASALSGEKRTRKRKRRSGLNTTKAHPL